MFRVLKSFRLRQVLRLAAMSVTFAVPALAADPAPEEAQARFEVDFLTDMIDHHQAAVAMAELVAERTDRAELKEMAASLATAQAGEIKTMQGWLEEWYGEEHEPALDRRAQRQVDALEEVEDDEFEQAFLRGMSPHHADGIRMMTEALLAAHHGEVLDLAREMTATQADEIVLMRGWLAEWHEIDEVTRRDRPDNRRWATAGPRIPSTVTPGGP